MLSILVLAHSHTYTMHLSAAENFSVVTVQGGNNENLDMCVCVFGSLAVSLSPSTLALLVLSI